MVTDDPPLICRNCHNPADGLMSCPCGCCQYVCDVCSDRIRYWLREGWQRWQESR